LAAPIRFFQRVKVIGKENVPKDGGFVMCANHIAIRDVILLGAACPRQIKFVAKKEIFKVPIIGSLVKWLGAIKLDRSGADIAAIKASIKHVEDGDIVAIFPQGHRYPGKNPATTPKKNGAALIAYRSGGDVLPVCIKTKKIKYTFFCKKEIIFGEVIPYQELGFKDGGNDEYREATDKIFASIVKLGGYDALPSPTEGTDKN
jgi:1-acyl-sn-glycerol-3-phosphate acyltransferase